MKKMFSVVIMMFVFCFVFTIAGYGKSTQEEINANLKTWREYIRNNPPNARAYAHLARWLDADKQYDKSIAAAKKSISIDPLNSIVHYNLGDAYYDKGSYPEAILSYKKVLEIKEGRENITVDEVYNRIARTYYKLMDLEKAVNFFEKAVANNPNYLKYREWLSWVYYCMGDYENALEHSNKVIEQSKYVGVGMRVGPGKPFPEIIEVFQDMPADKAGALAGDEIIKIKGISMKNKTGVQTAGYLKGKKGTKVKVLVRRQKRKSNLVMIRESIGLPASETSAELLSDRCLIYREIEEHEKARQDAKQAINMVPDFSKAKRAYAAVNIDAGNYEQAIEILSKADQEDVFVLLLTAIAYAKQGDIKKAMQLYEEKIAGNGSFLKKIPYISEQQKLFDVLASEIESILSNARKFEDKGKFQKALDEYSKVLMFMGKDEKEKIRSKLFEITARMSSSPKISKLARKHALRAEVLVKEGKFKDSILEFKKALLAAPYSAKLYLNNAIVCGKLGNYEQAIEQMKIYIKAVPQAPNIQEAEDQIIKWEFRLEQKEKAEK